MRNSILIFSFIVVFTKEFIVFNQEFIIYLTFISLLLMILKLASFLDEIFHNSKTIEKNLLLLDSLEELRYTKSVCDFSAVALDSFHFISNHRELSND